MKIWKEKDKRTGEIRCRYSWELYDIKIALKSLKPGEGKSYTQLIKHIISKTKPEGIDCLMNKHAGFGQILKKYLAQHPELDMVVTDHWDRMVIFSSECKEKVKSEFGGPPYECNPYGMVFDGEPCEGNCPYVDLTKSTVYRKWIKEKETDLESSVLAQMDFERAI